MSYVDKIVRCFGGVRKMAAHLGKASSTVGSWVARGSIPDANKAEILACSDRLGLGLDRGDFFPDMPGQTERDAA